MGREIVDEETKLPYLSLNHVSFICKSVQNSVKFYEKVLGFVLIKRPSSIDFEGAWSFNHGFGIHLLEAEKILEKKGKINPRDNHISFQCSDMDMIIKKLEGKKIEYVKAVVKEGGIIVDQIFFHDPDGYMMKYAIAKTYQFFHSQRLVPRKLQTSTNRHPFMRRSSAVVEK